MDARLVAFGILEIDGVRYEHDVVVDEGRVTKRKKARRSRYAVSTATRR